MVRLRRLLEEYTYLSQEHALLIFGMLAQHCLEETEEENDFLEGLSLDRILLNDNWYDKITDVQIEASEAPFKSYAYYPIEYLQGEEWNTESSAYALFAITYKSMTGELPYIGKVPEELLNSEEGLNYIIKKLKEGPSLDLNNISPVFQDFFKKGLALEKKNRYHAIGDTADDYNELVDIFCERHNDEETQDNLEKSRDLKPNYYGIFPQNDTMEFCLDVHTKEDGGLDDLVGLYEQKHIFRNGILAIIKNPQKAKEYKLELPNGYILYGPPGCGKTFFAKMFAAESQMNYAIINAQDIASTWVHGTQKLIKQLFEQAAAHAPIILIFDEIETMVPNRNISDNVKVAEETNAFLSELNTCAERGIFVIGTTNRPQFMDSAILRSGRFDKKIYFPLPDEQTRTEIFRSYLQNRPIKGHVDYQRLSELTSSGYISSDIRLICDEAATRAFSDDVLITQELLEQVIHEGGPSVSQKELRTYEESRKYLEPSSKHSQYINHIGFR